MLNIDKSNEQSEIDLLQLNSYNTNMTTNIYDYLERLHLDRDQLSEVDRYRIQYAYNDELWIKTAHKFLRNINRINTIPTKYITAVWGMIEDYKEKPLTHKQKIMLTNVLVDYWDQLTLEFRSLLPI